MKTHLKNHRLTCFLIPANLLFLVIFLFSYEAKAEGANIDLFNTDNGESLGDITGSFNLINLGSLPPNLTIVPSYIEVGTQSVVFYLNGKKVRTENLAPYAIGGDIDGKFFPYSIPIGDNKLSIDFHALPMGKGKVIGKLYAEFTVTNVLIPAVEIKLNPSDLNVTMPVAGKKTVTFNIDVAIDGPDFDYQLSSLFMEENSEAWINFPSPLKIGLNELTLNPINLPPGAYLFHIRIMLNSTNYPEGIYKEAILGIHLQVTPSNIPIITSFTLVDATTDQDRYINLLNGTSFDYFSLPPYFNIRANTYPEKIGSVIYRYYLEDYDGQSSPHITRRENVSPYALFGDINGDYKGQPIQGGTFFIQATPYPQPNGKGIAGPSVILEIYIYYAPNTYNANTRQTSITPDFSWKNAATPDHTTTFFSYPNSFSDQAIIQYTPNQNGFVTIEIFNFQGEFLKTLYKGEAEASQTLSLKFESEGLKDGIYLCRLQKDGKITTRRMLLKR